MFFLRLGPRQVRGFPIRRKRNPTQGKRSDSGG